ncbi:BTAD domain-containing putative transcriptional regulator [Actinosynnema sp. NPDC059335]|uniref:AfsR/SARP family transcriptional regulator n=1 Tax=Actinosynnema sp. NPDC059335 TaxID=3346804 RepID=UPI00366C776C
MVRTTATGYVAEVEPGALDLHRFRELAANGEYAEALALWRGAPLSDVRSDVLHAEEVEPLLEERLVVLERRIEADLAAGRAGDLVPELRTLTRAYPLRERFWGQLMLALHGSGRQAEALAAFGAVRELLAEELGVDPSEHLRAVHRTVLAGDAEPEPALSPWTALCQLPPDTADFIGRDDLCAEASALLTADPSGTAVPVLAITGAPGTGKSTLTIRVAHALRSSFPDGQLFVRLDGAGNAPRDPAEVLAELLTAVGVSPSALPDRLETRAAAFRSHLADRAVLLVLDDAAGVDQVRHLLPGTASSAVLISSRHQLGGLPGVRSLRVPPLPATSGLALLSRAIGEDRVAAEARAAEAIVEACGGLPLALRIVGARLAARRSLPLAQLAARLADERRRLDELATSDMEVRASLELSYEALAPDAALAFRRLGLLGASDVASWVVRALTGLDDPEHAVERLVEATCWRTWAATRPASRGTGCTTSSPSTPPSWPARRTPGAATRPCAGTSRRCSPWRTRRSTGCRPWWTSCRPTRSNRRRCSRRPRSRASPRTARAGSWPSRCTWRRPWSWPPTAAGSPRPSRSSSG